MTKVCLGPLGFGLIALAEVYLHSSSLSELRTAACVAGMTWLVAAAWLSPPTVHDSSPSFLGAPDGLLETLTCCTSGYCSAAPQLPVCLMGAGEGGEGGRLCWCRGVEGLGEFAEQEEEET